MHRRILWKNTFARPEGLLCQTLKKTETELSGIRICGGQKPDMEVWAQLLPHLEKSHTMKQSDDNKFIPMSSFSSGQGREVKSDIFYYTNQIVNLVFIGEPGSSWVMIDAGMPKSAEEIKDASESRFGKGSKPD